jgi:GntR family transcriptional regulator, transcriptional repressor for pyruvate dehydrogenase complex
MSPHGDSLPSVSENSAPLSLKPVPRSKLAAQVAERLLEEIRGKRLDAGTRMPSERELMTALNVGRSTIREAVNGLAMLGVLEIRHGQGAFVLNANAGTEAPSAIATALARGVTRDLFEARRLVEPEAARLAAERRTESDLREIAGALEDHAEALRTAAPAVEPSVRFHVSIGAAAHNEVLAGFVQSFQPPLTARGPALEAFDGFREWEIDQHRSVFEPVQAGEPGLAEERMRMHLDAVVAYHERLGLS